MANLNIAIQIAAKDNASGTIGKITNSLTGLKDAGLGGLQTVGKVALGGIAAGAGLVATGIGLIGNAAFGVANDVAAATGEIQAALGTTTEESARLAGIARDVWGNNFAGSISEAASAVGLVRQQLGDLSNTELKNAAEDAFRLSDNFGIDVVESVDAANTLMQQFGLTSDQAFDFIAKGVQNGLNRSGDFLDTIGEYSTQFSSGGASAAQFFSLLESGLQGGMLGTDKAADAFKEFRVRIQDGSTLTAESLEMIGISADELSARMADGSLTAADAFTMVVDALNEVDDENVRMQAGVGLLGTQFEDLGTEGALALSLIGTSMEEMAGATDTLDAKYNNLGSMFEGLKRRGLLALEPIGNVLLGLANNAMPLVEQAFAVFETTIVPAIETAAGVVQSFINNLSEGMSPLNAFIEAIWDIAPPEVLAFLTDLRDNILPGLSAWFSENVSPVLDMVAGFVSWQDVLTGLGIAIATVVIPAAITLIGSILAIAAPIVAIIGAVALLRAAWENNWGGIQEKTAAVVAFVQGIIAGLQAFWQVHGDTILAKGQAVWLGIQTAVNTAVVFIQNIVTTVMNALQAFWQTHGDTIKNIAQTAWNFIKTHIDTTLAVIKSVFAAFKAAFEGDWRSFGSNLRNAWDTAWNYIKTTLQNAGSALLNAVQTIINNIVNKFNSTNWGELGRNIIDGIVQALADGAAAVVAKITEIGQAAWEAWQGFWNASSPSKLAMQGAKNVTDGLLVQWNRDQDVLANAAASLGQAAYSGMFGSSVSGNLGTRSVGAAPAVRGDLGGGGGSGKVVNVHLINPKFYGVENAGSLLAELESLSV